MKAAALITAAGLSRRFNHTYTHQKKELMPLEGSSVLQHAVEAFLELSEVEHILVTYPMDDTGESRALLEHIVRKLKLPDHMLSWTKGGNTRQESVYNGLRDLASLSPEMVFIHDGARPWITPTLIKATLEKALSTGAAAPGLFSRNALKTIDDDGHITSHHSREAIVEVQTPQVFRYAEILEAHRLAQQNNKEYIDDTEVLTDWGGTVFIVPGDPNNIKITYYRDLERLS
ncbi:MAG: IspD/TarI family cytidylyltransferase [Spirochaetota bacterium]